MSVANGWLDAEWLTVIAIALSFSFVIAAVLTSRDDKIYRQFRMFWLKLQTKERLPDDKVLDLLGATIAIFGMGRVGSGAYDKMRERFGKTVIGIDFDIERVKRHQILGRNVLQGDPSDTDFWEKLRRIIVSSSLC